MTGSGTSRKYHNRQLRADRQTFNGSNLLHTLTPSRPSLERSPHLQK
jgi:hypothetical protein